MKRLDELRTFLEPRRLVDRVRVYVLPRQWGTFDIATAEERTGIDTIARLQVLEELVIDLGKELIGDEEALGLLLPELSSGSPGRARALGRGLATAAFEFERYWQFFVAALSAVPAGDQNPDLLRGFLGIVHERAPATATKMLDDAVTNAVLSPFLVELQLEAAIDTAAVTRLREALHSGATPVKRFARLYLGHASNSASPSDFAQLLRDIAARPDGHPVAVEVLYMQSIASRSNTQPVIDGVLLCCGQDLLRTFKFEDYCQADGYALSELAKICLVGDAQITTEHLCKNILAQIGPFVFVPDCIEQLLLVVIVTQTSTVLDEFFLNAAKGKEVQHWNAGDDFLSSVLAGAPVAQILAWAELDSDARFPLLAGSVGLFKKEHGAKLPELSPVARALVENASVDSVMRCNTVMNRASI